MQVVESENMAKRSALGALRDLSAALPTSRLRRELLGRSLRLPAVRNEVVVERDLPVPMHDGAILYADHYAPRRTASSPTVLVRTPYGRGEDVGFPLGTLANFIALRFAERGYHVLIQTVRGRFDSDGAFEPFLHEREDGRSTLRWLSERPWFDGQIVAWGPSYLGFTQWALADEAPDTLKALMPTIIGTRFNEILRSQGAFSLDTLLRWIYLTDLSQHRAAAGQSRLRDLALIRPGGMSKALTPAFAHLPLATADSIALGRPDSFYQNVVAHPDDGDGFWAAAAPDLSKVAAPAHLFTGWYDFMLPELLLNHQTLVEAARAPYLTIGPWAHTSPGLLWDSVRQGLTWFDAHTKGDASDLRSRPVRFNVMGIDQWRDVEVWPPPALETPFYLRGESSLGIEEPSPVSSTDHYRYDPADPTPAVAGAMFLPPSGPVDNRALEMRPDVLTYTMGPLRRSIEIVGPVTLVLYVSSTLEHTDFFGRLCDVHPDGRSVNLCDGLLRVSPGVGEIQSDGSLRLDLPLWPTANRFLRGHSIRLQVSSGAHPRWSRNLGTGEPVETGVTMNVADQTIYHDAEHPSALLLPVTLS